MTAAANPNSLSRALGESDLQALKRIRTMTDTHVKAALKSAESEATMLTAAATPGQFIDPAWIEQFGHLMDDLWFDGLGVVDDLFRVRMRMPLAPRSFLNNIVSEAVETAKMSYTSLLQELVSKHAYPLSREPVYGEFRTGNAVQYGDVRGLLVKLGGGTTDPQVELVGGITTGKTMQEYFADSDISTEQRIWLYGWEEQPRRTFNGHLQMDGLVFEEWDDNGLVISPQDRWLRRNYYAPGDHYGCACVVAPYFPNMDEPFEI